MFKNIHTDTTWKVFKYIIFSGPYFPVFGLNMEIYSVNIRIQSEYRKIRRKNSVSGPFSRNVVGIWSDLICLYLQGFLANIF